MRAQWRSAIGASGGFQTLNAAASDNEAAFAGGAINLFHRLWSSRATCPS